MLYWYNQSPNSAGVIPADAVYGCATDSLSDVSGNSVWHKTVHLNPYKIGDTAYVKPPNL